MAKTDVSKLRVAIVADWLTNQGGAEVVIHAMHEALPQAPIYTSMFNPTKLPQFAHADVRTSFLDHFPFAPLSQKKHQWFLPWMPQAFESFDLSDFDIVLSSSHSCAKGIITKPETLHVSYCHTPMRYVWDGYLEYMEKTQVPFFVKPFVPGMLSKVRQWDRLASDRVDWYFTNSQFVTKRIHKYYRRDSEVLYPPVRIQDFSVSHQRGDYFVALGRLIPYKRFDLTIEACNRLKLPLKIIGEGPEYARLKEISGPTIQFMGFVSPKERKELLAGSRALIFPQVEDFGIVPLEAMASGRPVVALGQGGALETVVEGVTGTFFPDQTPDSLTHALERFLTMQFDHKKIRAHAEEFDIKVFQANLLSRLGELYDEYQSGNMFVRM